MLREFTPWPAPEFTARPAQSVAQSASQTLTGDGTREGAP
jgi:hypothetical protein